MTKPSLWHLFKKGVIITIGCLIYAISINLFFVPANLNTGGLTGIALIFNTLWNLPVGHLAGLSYRRYLQNMLKLKRFKRMNNGKLHLSDEYANGGNHEQSGTQKNSQSGA